MQVDKKIVINRDGGNVHYAMPDSHHVALQFSFRDGDFRRGLAEEIRRRRQRFSVDLAAGHGRQRVNDVEVFRHHIVGYAVAKHVGQCMTIQSVQATVENDKCSNLLHAVQLYGRDGRLLDAGIFQKHILTDTLALRHRL